MSALQFESPILLDMQILSCLSENGGISTYLVKDQYSDRKFVFKNISIPASQTQVDGLKFSGAISNDEEAQSYYAQVVNAYKVELESLKRAADSGNVEAYPVWHVQAKKDAIGFDLHLLMPYRQTLQEYLADTPMTHARATTLAMDLCNSLEHLRKAGIVHCNLKPSNIYINHQGQFSIGDLGVIAVNDLKYAAVSERYLGKFTAPELFDVMQTPDATIDLYSLGLLLYSIYNGGHDPFEDEQTSSKSASDMRMAGKKLPVPIFADYEIAEIILKACEFSPADRYQTPAEMKQDLAAYIERNAPDDTLIVPPLIVDDDILLTDEAMQEELTPMQLAKSEDLEEDFVHHFSPDAEVLNDSIQVIQNEQADAVEIETPVPAAKEEEAQTFETAEEDEDEVEEEAVAPAPKKKVWKWLGICGAAVVALALIAYFALIPHVGGFTLVDADANSLTISLDSLHKANSFDAICTDSFGNSFEGKSVDGKLVFDTLSPGTQYTVKLFSSLGMNVRGVREFTVSTPMATTITAFHVKALSATSVELSFEITGRDQETWKLAYGAEGTEKEVSFSGHNVVIDGLETDKVYTFTLLDSQAVALSGETAVSYDTTVRVAIAELTQEDTTEGTILTWTYSGTDPESWTVSWTTPDGSKKEQSVTTARAPIFGIEGETDYEIEIFCEGMSAPYTATIRKKMPTMDSFSAEASGDGEITVNWASKNATTEGWKVVVKLSGTGTIVFSETVSANSASLTVKGLVPDAAYDVSVTPMEGWAVDGTHTATVSTKAAQKFSSYGCTSTYMGLFMAPAKENWTVSDLSVKRESYAANETIAIAVEAISGVQKSADEVVITLALRGSDGSIASQSSHQAVWNDIWTNRLFVDSLKLGDIDAGAYIFELYFNGRFVAKRDVTIR